jgi:hypothetical protein
MSMLRLLSDRIGDFILEIRVGVNDIPTFRHGGTIRVDTKLALMLEVECG